VSRRVTKGTFEVCKVGLFPWHDDLAGGGMVGIIDFEILICVCLGKIRGTGCGGGAHAMLKVGTTEKVQSSVDAERGDDGQDSVIVGEPGIIGCCN